MTDAKKTIAPPVIAETFETLAEEIVDARLSVAPVKAGQGRARILKVVNKDGKVVGLVTHGKVLEAAARAAQLEIEVQDGTRPDVILCIECKAPREVKTGPLPKHCKSCAAKANREAQRKAQRKWRAANPEANREAKRKRRAAYPEANRDAERKWRAANLEANREADRKWRAANLEANREAERKRYAANPEAQREAQRKYRARKKAEHEAEKAKTTKGSE